MESTWTCNRFKLAFVRKCETNSENDESIISYFITSYPCYILYRIISTYSITSYWSIWHCSWMCYLQYTEWLQCVPMFICWEMFFLPTSIHGQNYATLPRKVTAPGSILKVLWKAMPLTKSLKHHPFINFPKDLDIKAKYLLRFLRYFFPAWVLNGSRKMPKPQEVAPPQCL